MCVLSRARGALRFKCRKRQVNMRKAVRVAIGALLFVVGCGAPNGQGSGPLPLPSPPIAALAAWKDFPANSNPRPIIWLSVPNLVTAFPSNDTKIAGICNKLVLQDGLTLSDVIPAQATASWPSGVTGSYRAISAATAFVALLHVPSGAGGGMCDGVKPLVISSVSWRTAGVETDRGTAQMSAWLFQAAGVTGEFAYPGLDHSAYWRGGLMPAGSGPGFGGRVSPDGHTLTIGFAGAPDTPGACGADYTAAAAESDAAVAVAVKMIPHAALGQVVCPAVAQGRTVIVHLAAPLGGRVLVDENSNVGVACPENENC
jgi:hypothetical protein